MSERKEIDLMNDQKYPGIYYRNEHGIIMRQLSKNSTDAVPVPEKNWKGEPYELYSYVVSKGGKL